MPGLDVNQSGIVSRVLPNPTADGNLKVGPRFLRYGEQAVTQFVPTLHTLSDEGTYFVATNPTVSTGIKLGSDTATAFSDTGAGIALVNNDAVGGKRIYLDYIKLILVTAGVGDGTPFHQIALKTDNVQTRYTSGGTLLTPVSPNTDSGLGSIAKPYFGNLVTAAGTSAARLIGRQNLRLLLGVVGDIVLLTFGSVEKVVTTGQLLNATSAMTLQANFPPIILGPNAVLSLHTWAPTRTTAPTYEFEMGWWER